MYILKDFLLEYSKKFPLSAGLLLFHIYINVIQLARKSNLCECYKSLDVVTLNGLIIRAH